MEYSGVEVWLAGWWNDKLCSAVDEIEELNALFFVLSDAMFQFVNSKLNIDASFLPVFEPHPFKFPSPQKRVALKTSFQYSSLALSFVTNFIYKSVFFSLSPTPRHTNKYKSKLTYIQHSNVHYRSIQDAEDGRIVNIRKTTSKYIIFKNQTHIPSRPPHRLIADNVPKLCIPQTMPIISCISFVAVEQSPVSYCPVIACGQGQDSTRNHSFQTKIHVNVNSGWRCFNEIEWNRTSPPPRFANIQPIVHHLWMNVKMI